MKKLLLALALFLAPSLAAAQCNGVFPAHTLCGNLSSVAAPPSAFSSAGSILGPGTSTLDGLPKWGDTSGTALVDAAGTTVAGAYTWSGTQTFTLAPVFTDASGSRTALGLGTAATAATGTSGATIPFLNGNNTWSGNNTFSTGTFNFTGTFQIGGATVSLPVSAANGGTGVASPTTHTIPINQGAAAQIDTGAGNAGQCIVSGGAGVDPAFASGCTVLLNTLTASTSVSLADTTSLTSAYHDYLIIFDNIIPATNGASFVIQVSTDGGGSYLTSTYINAINCASNATTAQDGATANIQMNIASVGIANTAALGFSGNATIHDPSAGTHRTYINGNVTYTPGSVANIHICVFAGFQNSASTAVNAIKFVMTSGNITSGTVRIYGRI